MPLLELLSSSPPFLAGFVFLFALMVGSFLNVVIYRLPVAMQRQWLQQARAILDQTGSEPEEESAPFNLAYPHSHCPVCKTPIKAYDNIPVISYLILKGRCRHCKTPISWRYPIVELVTGVLSAFVAWHFGFQWLTLFALLFTWILLAATLIDWDTQLLPDSLTLPLLWLGLLANTQQLFATLPDAVFGAAAGYLFLWSIFWIFKLLTGKEGMGYGDFKLLAALGAWFGWQYLPLIIILSSVAGTLFGLLLMLRQPSGTHESKPFAFGPFLAVAGWITLIAGPELINQYFLFFKL